MLIVRDIFTARPGQASKLASLMKRIFVKDPDTRVMTDLVGDFNTVIMERKVKDLAEYEAQIKAYLAGDPHGDKVDREAFKEMGKYTEMYFGGRREIFKIVE